MCSTETWPRYVLSAGRSLWASRPLAYQFATRWTAKLCRLSRARDKRHTFAVRALESSPAGRHRIGQHMVALATYLGHVNIDATYWYLSTTPELLGAIAAAAESVMCGGRP